MMLPIAAAASEERLESHLGVGVSEEYCRGGISRSLQHVLALGGADGHVRLWWLHGGRCEDEISEARVLPSPYAESYELAACPQATTAASNGGGLRVVLALECVSAHLGLGLLVGVYAWGAALWQVAPWSEGGSVLINMWRRGAHPLRTLPPPLPVNNIAPLLLARSPRAMDSCVIDASREFHVEPTDPLGHVLVGAALGWAAPPDTTAEALVHSFTFSRTDCCLEKGYVARVDGGKRGALGALVCLAASEELLSGCDGRGTTFVWDLSSTECLLVLHAYEASPMVLSGTSELYMWQHTELGLRCHLLSIRVPQRAEKHTCAAEVKERFAAHQEKTLLAPSCKQLRKRAAVTKAKMQGSQSLDIFRRAFSPEEVADDSEEHSQGPSVDDSINDLQLPWAKRRHFALAKGRRFAY